MIRNSSAVARAATHSPEPTPAELEATFAAFCDENFLRVERHLRARCADRNLVDEAVQETFITARAKWAQIRGFDQPLAWVLKTARYKLQGQQSRRNRTNTTMTDLDTVPPEFITQPTDPREADELLVAWLQQLPPRQAEVFVLFLDGWRDLDIAKMLGLAHTTVRAYKQQARQHLQRLAEQAGFNKPTTGRSS
ncbi:RNA polymerase sigma factor (sigma-70 family) [Micromonospora violae]|uniref:RNA polymerase sigma factor (Sigma-70 family) n=1 Tax=Micromonospora violae TaxID=1278207 RepID=A0A4Q7UMI4_9ACTN|nr:RNA polymerase sigma factor [Micromonospora violae]RZT82735.1 RNA polymerase sigma factor (sigma-70 family) [Micromonospora violae]